MIPNLKHAFGSDVVYTHRCAKGIRKFSGNITCRFHSNVLRESIGRWTIPDRKPSEFTFILQRSSSKPCEWRQTGKCSTKSKARLPVVLQFTPKIWRISLSPLSVRNTFVRHSALLKVLHSFKLYRVGVERLPHTSSWLLILVEPVAIRAALLSRL